MTSAKGPSPLRATRRGAQAPPIRGADNTGEPELPERRSPARARHKQAGRPSSSVKTHAKTRLRRPPGFAPQILFALRGLDCAPGLLKARPQAGSCLWGCLPARLPRAGEISPAIHPKFFLNSSSRGSPGGHGDNHRHHWVDPRRPYAPAGVGRLPDEEQKNEIAQAPRRPRMELHGGDTPRSRQIFRASRSEISAWRGTVEVLCARRLT